MPKLAVCHRGSALRSAIDEYTSLSAERWYCWRLFAQPTTRIPTKSGIVKIITCFHLAAMRVYPLPSANIGLCTLMPNYSRLDRPYRKLPVFSTTSASTNCCSNSTRSSTNWLHRHVPPSTGNLHPQPKRKLPNPALIDRSFGSFLLNSSHRLLQNLCFGRFKPRCSSQQCVRQVVCTNFPAASSIKNEHASHTTTAMLAFDMVT